MKIDQLLAYCGLTCRSCPIHLATKESDTAKQKKMRAQIAEYISDHYGLEITPQDVTDCDGCTTASGRLYTGCRTCEVRACAQEKGCVTCAHCADYPCDKLQKIFASEPSAKSRLDAIRKTLSN